MSDKTENQEEKEIQTEEIKNEQTQENQEEKVEEVSAEDYHSLSVQNTKNGNYSIAIAALEKAMELDPKEISPYYGWVLLYYYRDYEKSLKILEQY